MFGVYIPITLLPKGAAGIKLFGNCFYSLWFSDGGIGIALSHDIISREVFVF